MRLPGMCPLLPSTVMQAGFEEHFEAYQTLLIDNVDEWCPGSFSSAGRDNFQDHSGMGGVYESSVKGHGIIMLRQPEQRLISAYYYHQHSWPLWYYGRFATDLLEFAQVVSGCAVRMLTREGWAPVPCGGPEPASGAEVILARQRLREGFVFVGITDEWDMSVCLLHAVFGGACLASDFADNNAGTNSSQELYDTSELMGFTDAADGALYKEALAIFAEQQQHYGVSYGACQPCFQQALSSK